MSDLISRQGVSAWLYNMGHEKLSEYVLDEKRFPSEDRPTGKWIPKLSSEDKVKRYECSMCGYVHIKHPYTVEFYCPNCGVRMFREDGENVDK